MYNMKDGIMRDIGWEWKRNELKFEWKKEE